MHQIFKIAALAPLLLLLTGCPGCFETDRPAVDDPDIPIDTAPVIELVGCARDWFTVNDGEPELTLFAFPVQQEGAVLPELAALHFDHDPQDDVGLLDCVSYDGNHNCYNKHKGTDYPLSPVFFKTAYVTAAASGVVMGVEDSNLDLCSVPIGCVDIEERQIMSIGNSNYVRICHHDGTESIYYHIMTDSLAVEVGQKVACGDRLATIGSSGKSMMPHLHFQVEKRDADDNLKKLDPYAPAGESNLWLSQSGGSGGHPSRNCPD